MGPLAAAYRWRRERSYAGGVLPAWRPGVERGEVTGATMRLDWWDRHSNTFLDEHLAGDKEIVRVATGFFSASGYDLLRQHFDDCRLNVFVGYDERSQEELQRTFLDEFFAQLGNWQADRYAAVAAMVEKLDADELRVMDARARSRDHAKVYIVDNQRVIVGSVNLTRSGLLHNFEGATVVTDPEQVADWIVKFESYWNAPDTIDISGALLDRLRAWLQLRRPWEVYLKAALELLRAQRPWAPRDTYRVPAEYQMVVIKRALRQLREHRGAMIVASTGLGKTVMGSHIAVELKREGRIGNALVLGPRAVAEEWRERLESGEVPVRVYTSDLLDRKLDGNQYGKTREVVDLLERLDDRWLIIVDESHRFKNRVNGPATQRRSFTRLLSAVATSNCHVLLLTATPFAAEQENINNQLLLLPHTGPNSAARLDFTPGAHPWRIASVAELSELAVATVLNTPYVAKTFAHRDHEADADFILYPDGSRWYLPRLRVRRVQAPLIAEEALTPLLNDRRFQHAPAPIVTREGVRMLDDTVEERVCLSWASSPWELKRVLENVSSDAYGVRFYAPLAERQRMLRPIIDRLDGMRHVHDPKFMRAYAVVRAELAKGNKVVLFSERYATAGYLEQGLRRLLPQHGERIACTVEKVKGAWGLKDHRREVAPLIRHFAPQANRGENGLVPEDRYDVFITTDAYAEGVNLQDSSVLISYDIAWTADTIIQRAGRVMRFWSRPRDVQLICFTVDKELNLQVGPVASRPSRRLQRLEARLEEATVLSEIPILPEDEAAYPALAKLSTIEIQEAEIDRAMLEAPELSEVSRVLEDYTQLNRHRDQAEALDDDIATAFVTDEVTVPTLLTLLRTEHGPVRVRYDTHTHTAQEVSENEFFGLLRCEETTELALVDPARVEGARHEAVAAWLGMGLEQDERLVVEHVCSALLMPTSSDALLVLG